MSISIIRGIRVSVDDGRFRADFSSDEDEIYVFDKENGQSIVFSGTLDDSAAICALVTKLIAEVNATTIVKKEAE